MPFATAIGGMLFGYGGTAAFAPTAGLLTAGNVALGTMAVSTAMTTKAQSDAGKTEKRWQEYNAAISEQTGKAIQESALHEEKTHRKAGRRHIARMIVEGYSPLMLEETAGEIEKDALIIRRGGVLGEQKLKSQAVTERGKGAFARRTGRWRAGATLLSGGTRMADLYGSSKGYW